MGVRCYHCKSSETKTVTAAMEQLQINTNSTTVGGGIFGGGGGGIKGGVGVAKTEGGSSPELINKLQKRIPLRPPGPGIPISWWVVFGIWFFTIASFNPTIGSVPALILAWGGVPVLLWRRKIWKKEYAKKFEDYKEEYKNFKKLWYCFSCGGFSTTKDS